MKEGSIGGGEESAMLIEAAEIPVVEEKKDFPGMPVSRNDQATNNGRRPTIIIRVRRKDNDWNYQEGKVR